jgi:hypothetical protein
MTSGTPHASCPKCGSPSVQAVPIEKKKLGEAVLAEYFLGTAAGVASGSKMVIQAVCLACGCQWFPGSEGEQRIRALSGQLGPAAKRAAEQTIARENARKETESRNTTIATILFLVLGGGAIVWAGRQASSKRNAPESVPAPSACSAQSETLVVRTLTRARVSRSVSSAWRYQLKPGTQVAADSLTQGWYLICWGGQQPGWVRSTELTHQPPRHPAP